MNEININGILADPDARARMLTSASGPTSPMNAAAGVDAGGYIVSGGCACTGCVGAERNAGRLGVKWCPTRGTGWRCGKYATLRAIVDGTHVYSCSTCHADASLTWESFSQ